MSGRAPQGVARAGCVGPPDRRGRTGRAVLLLLVQVLLAGAGAPGPAAAQAAEDPAVAPLPAELERAWLQRAVAGVLALFAPDGVIQIDPENLKGPVMYQAGGWQSLGVGVPVLLGEGTGRIDVAGRQTTVIVFHEAPASLVRWGYQQTGPAGRSSAAAGSQPPLPPVTGTDELVLQGGRIARYTRRPDPASVAARRHALNAAAADRPALPDTQARRTPSLGPWLVALRGLRGMAVVSGYPGPLYRELYAGWPMVTRRARTNGPQSATEALWLSPRAAARLSTRQLSLLEEPE